MLKKTVVAFTIVCAIIAVGCSSQGTQPSDQSGSGSDSSQEASIAIEGTSTAEPGINDSPQTVEAGGFTFTVDAGYEIKETKDGASLTKGPNPEGGYSSSLTIEVKEASESMQESFEGDSASDLLDLMASSPASSIEKEADSGSINLSEHITANGIEFATAVGDVKRKGITKHISIAYGYANGKTILLIGITDEPNDLAIDVASTIS